MSKLILFSYLVAGFFALFGAVRFFMVMRHNIKVQTMAERKGVSPELALQASSATFTWIELVGMMGLCYLVAAWLT